jgi:hypothetical protein
MAVSWRRDHRGHGLHLQPVADADQKRNANLVPILVPNSRLLDDTGRDRMFSLLRKAPEKSDEVERDETRSHHRARNWTSVPLAIVCKLVVAVSVARRDVPFWRWNTKIPTSLTAMSSIQNRAQFRERR